MSEFYEMIRYTRCHHDKLKKLCAPLFRALGFNCLFYHHISKDGYGTSFASHVESYEYYLHHHLYRINPYARHPDFFHTSVHLLPQVKHQPYQESLEDGANKFDIAYQVVVLEKTVEGCQGFSFAMSKKQRDLAHLSVNQIPLIQCFIKYFKRESQSILQASRDIQLPLKTAIGSNFHVKPDFLFSLCSFEKKVEFLKQMGVISSEEEIHLTSREVDCIKLLLQGYTANQIANTLGLSKRTIEHYLEGVKLKSNCDSKLELFEKFKEIENLGLLSNK